MIIATYVVVATSFAASYLMARKRLTNRRISVSVALEYLVAPLILIAGVLWFSSVSGASEEWTAGLLGAATLLAGFVVFSFGAAAFFLIFALGAMLTAGNALFDVIAWLSPRRILLVLTALLSGDVVAFSVRWLAPRRHPSLRSEKAADAAMWTNKDDRSI